MNFALVKFRYSKDDPWIVQLCTEEELEHFVNSKDDLDHLTRKDNIEFWAEYKKSFVVLTEFECDLLNLSMGVDEYLGAK